MNKLARLTLATAILCLMISGAAGLVYQVVWMRYLSLFLGHTSYAVVAVLVSFMGGLALGNAWLGAQADRVQRPLALYAWLEIGIGLYALLFPTYYEWIHQAYVGLARGLTPGSTALFALKFAFSLLTILVPTVLMGGTLPVMTKLVTRSLGELRERVATLYFVNSAGAVVGCFLADFWWIPAIGLEATVFAGATMNLLVGVVAWMVSIRLREEGGVPGPAERARSEEETFTPAELRLAVAGIGVSGFVAMLYEVVWTRLLALALGSSTHAFSIMLITFITGIAAGAWMVRRWRGLRRSLDAFGWAELALAGTLAVSMWFYELVPYWFSRVSDLLARQPSTYPLYEAAQALICFLVMFVPTLCLGMTLPLVSRVATAELARTGRSVGTVFAVNTLGTVLGAALAGLWLMPALGLARTLGLGIALNAVLGGLTIWRKRFFARPALALAGAVAWIALATLAAGTFNEPWQRLSTLALWREKPMPNLATYRLALKMAEIKYYRDGAGSTVTVEAWKSKGQESLVLRVNGKPDATTSTDVPTQLLLGHVPLLLRASPRQVLVVGLGSGMTGGAVLQHPGVEALDLVEISPEVVDGAQLFSPYNHDVLHHPKTRLVVDDAKSFLQMSDRQYDVIISEPSNPWLAGVAGVFSREYYESCRARLQPDGLMAQWVQAYETDDATLDIVLNTFLSVFPHASVWEVSLADLMLVGSPRPLRVDLELMQRRLQEPAVKADLERIDLFRLSALLARELIPPENTRFIPVPAGRIHSDYYPILDYVAQRAFFVRSQAQKHAWFDQNRSTRPTTLLGRYLQNHKLTDKDFQALGLFYLTYKLPDPRLSRSLLQGWHAEFPDATEPLEMLAKSMNAATAAEVEAQRMARQRDKLFAEAAKDPQLLRIYSSLLYQAYTEARSAFYVPPAAELEAVLQRLADVDPTNRRVYQLLLAEIAWDKSDDTTCFQLANSALALESSPDGLLRFELDPKAPARVLTRMIESLCRAQRFAEAWRLCEQARRNGYVGPQSAGSDPILEMTVRKVEAIVSPTSDAQTGGNPAPRQP